jgi:hypothetical protein
MLSHNGCEREEKTSLAEATGFPQTRQGKRSELKSYIVKNDVCVCPEACTLSMQKMQKESLLECEHELQFPLQDLFLIDTRSLIQESSQDTRCSTEGAAHIHDMVVATLSMTMALRLGW